MTQDERAIPKNITLYPSELAVVKQVGKDNAFRSDSAAIRWIINQFVRLTRENGGAAPAPVQEAA